MGKTALRKKAIKTLAAFALLSLASCSTNNPLLDDPSTRKLTLSDGQKIQVINLPRQSWESPKDEIIIREAEANVAYEKGSLTYSYYVFIHYSNFTPPIKIRGLLKYGDMSWSDITPNTTYTYERQFELEGYKLLIRLNGYVSNISQGKLTLYFLPYYQETIPNRFKNSQQ